MTTKSTFRELHDDLLLLPNAWDAGSARLFESLGAKAIATTSAGVAWARGYPDAGAFPLEPLLATVREIVRVINVPLSVDIEGGYSDDAGKVGQLVTRVLEAGAVGINLEDGSGSPEILCAKIEAAKDAAKRADIDLFINVRTDVYLRELATGDAAVEEVLRRAKLYRAAGGDGIFVPGLDDGTAMERIATAIHPAPLNIMLVPGLPSLEALRKHGVRRLSAGSGIAQAVMGLSRRLAKDFLDGSFDSVFDRPLDYGAANQLFVTGEQARLGAWRARN